MSPLFFNAESGEIREVLDGEPDLPNTTVWQPLAELLVAQEFPYKHEDFPRPKTRPWDGAQVRKLGLLVAQDLAELDPASNLTEVVANRLNCLGVFPSSAYFATSTGHYRGLTDFRAQIGADKLASVQNIKSNTERAQSNSAYAELGLPEFTQLILDRYNELVELPDEQVYDGPITLAMIEAMNRMDIAPAWIFIKKKYGGLAELNEYLGFPDIRNWDVTDFIQYGARFIKENGVNLLTETNINRLSQRHLGPAKSTITERFGSISAFQDLAVAEYARQSIIDEARVSAIERHFTEITYEKDIPEDPSERAIIWGRYQIASAILPGVNTSELAEISKSPNGNFVHKLLTRKDGLTVADIEIMAVSLQVEDYIWPPVNQRSLKV